MGEHRERIKSSDPRAIHKLTKRLHAMDERHEAMVKANRIIRAKQQHKLKKLQDLGWSLDEAMNLCESGGFDQKELRRSHTLRQQTRKRIKDISDAREAGRKSATVIDGIDYFEDPTRMRVGFRFERAAIPKVISRYLVQRGFWYSMERGSFERHLSDSTRKAAANAKLFLRRWAGERT